MTEEKKDKSEEKELCGQPCEVYSRVVGYMRPVNAWNKGKKEEWKKRKAFKVEPEEKEEEKP